MAPWEREPAEYPDFMRPATRAPWAAPEAAAAKPPAPTAARADVIERASLYLAECDPAVQGDAGHDKLFWAAGALVHGFKLSDDQTLQLLVKEYNPRCVPPWNLSIPSEARDFTRKITEARRKPPEKPAGWLLENNAVLSDIERVRNRQATNTLLANELGKQAATKATSNEATGRLNTHNKIVYPAMTCAELMKAEFDIRFLVDGILVAGQPCILAGPKKTLKTSVSIDLAVSLAFGGYFLGEFKAPEAVRVGIMTGESGLATIQETVQRICIAAGLDPQTLISLIITDRIPQLESHDHLEALQSFIQQYQLEVLIVDPLYLAMSGADAGNVFAQGRLLRRISELAQAEGVTLILCHHAKKNRAEPYAQPELDDIAWAGFSEFARQWLLLGRREQYQPGSGQHRLWLSAGGSAGHGGLWGLDVSEGGYQNEGGRVWETEVLSDAEIRSANKEQRERQKADTERLIHQDRCKKVWNYLCTQPDGDTQNGISEKAKINKKNLEPVLDNLLEQGNVETCKVKRGNGAEYDGYRVVQEASASGGKQGDLFV